MRRVNKNIVEINTEAGIKLVVFKSPQSTIGIKVYFQDAPVDLNKYLLTTGDVKELAEALLELAND